MTIHVLRNMQVKKTVHLVHCSDKERLESLDSTLGALSSQSAALTPHFQSTLTYIANNLLGYKYSTVYIKGVKTLARGPNLARG